MFTDFFYLLALLASGAVICVEQNLEGPGHLVTVIDFNGDARPIGGLNSLAMPKSQAMFVAQWLRDYQSYC